LLLHFFLGETAVDAVAAVEEGLTAIAQQLGLTFFARFGCIDPARAAGLLGSVVQPQGFALLPADFHPGVLEPPLVGLVGAVVGPVLHGGRRLALFGQRLQLLLPLLALLLGQRRIVKILPG